jgi:ABC-type nitrate/sulfonate/bicarbonate transport system permease component
MRKPLPAGRLALFHALLLSAVFAFWYVMTEPGLIPPFFFEDANQAKFFFGQPGQVLARIWDWFAGGKIYVHLWITLVETMLAFVIGTLRVWVSGCGSHCRRLPPRWPTRTSKP